MHGFIKRAIKWATVGAILALMAGIFVAVLIVEGVKSLAQRAAPRRMRPGLARWGADLAGERSEGTREGRTSAALATAPAIAEAGIGPATRARLIGVDELILDEPEEAALFI